MSTKISGLCPPSNIQKWDGWAFDTTNDCISVPQDKVDKLVNAFHSVLSESKNNTHRAKSFASAIGLANHDGEVFYQGRRKCWMDGVKETLERKGLNIQEAKVSVQDRSEWRSVCRGVRRAVGEFPA